jgi:hypothetical protein
MGKFLTDPACIKQRVYINIPQWNNAGFTGKGLTIFHDDVDLNSSHSQCCVDILKTILPDAKILSGRIDYSSDNSIVSSCIVNCYETKENLPFEEFIVKNDVSLINNSTSGGRDNNNSAIAVYMRSMIKKYNLIGTGSYGNYGEVPTNKFQGAFIMVSGVDNDMTDYGVSGKDCDFSMFMGFQDGTSFSAPFLLGMIGLYRSKYGKITQNEVYNLLKSNCQDLGTVGKDEQWGWGLPKMADVTKKYITMTIGSNDMYVDGIKVVMDTAPVIDKFGRTLVPIRKPMETLGHKVDWIADEKKVCIYE